MGNTRYRTKANGQSFAELEYDVWSNPTSPNMLLNNDNGVFVIARFTGHAYDTVLDMYFAQARFYDANYNCWNPIWSWFLQMEEYSGFMQGGHPACYMKLQCSYTGDNVYLVNAMNKYVHMGIVYANAIRSENDNYMTDERKQANALYIYDYLSTKGWTRQAIAGLLGNIEEESHMNPGVWEKQNRLDLGYGLIQWDDATKFLDTIDSNGEVVIGKVNKMAEDEPQRLMDLQLEFLIESMKPSGGEWLPKGSDKYYNTDERRVELVSVCGSDPSTFIDPWGLGAYSIPAHCEIKLAQSPP